MGSNGGAYQAMIDHPDPVKIIFLFIVDFEQEHFKINERII